MEWLIVHMLKPVWARPRMRLIVSDPSISFESWWKINDRQEELALHPQIPAEEFESFPSGHTADASAMMLLYLLPLLKPEWKKKKNILFGIGVFWTASVALSRIVIGAHFLSDVAAGFLIGLAAMVMAVRLVFHP